MDPNNVVCPHGYPVCDECLEGWIEASRKPDLYEFLYEVWATAAEIQAKVGNMEETRKCEVQAKDWKELMFRWNDRQSG